ncbi:MAG: TetR family transcriptional regulator [Bacteroidota bacterium]|nr:TetR family transcriptional regulator [Bacteroidota bacterium]MDP4216534.1 TetR family transcriptional regulator [Bacteroidota bacterium]MDP4246285.1 TetR family transcriptional regulator [Bacteroidota bacterium]MDP4259888.1 TetR family transcriptional regulator [Bacteroidota bacterium]
MEKAAPLFNQKGIAGTSISDIMEATRLAKGGIYGNFTGKEEISLAAFDHIVNIVAEEVRRLTSGESTARGKLNAILEFYRTYPTNPPMKGGCPVINFGTEADDTNPLLRRRVNEVILQFQQSIERLVQRGIRDGEFRQEWDARIFAIKMYAMMEGGIMISRIQNSNRQMSLIIDLLQQEMAGWLT